MKEEIKNQKRFIPIFIIIVVAILALILYGYFSPKPLSEKQKEQGKFQKIVHCEMVNNGLTDPNVITLATFSNQPTTLYAGTLAGVFKSTNMGDSWMPMNNGLTMFFGAIPAVSKILKDNRGFLYIYAGKGDFIKIYSSSDGGATWRDISPEWNAEDLTIHKGKAVILTLEDFDTENFIETYELYIFSGYAREWIPSYKLRGISCKWKEASFLGEPLDTMLFCNPQLTSVGNSLYFYNSLDKTLYKSQDDGKMWNIVDFPLPDSYIAGTSLRSVFSQQIPEGYFYYFLNQKRKLSEACQEIDEERCKKLQEFRGEEEISNMIYLIGEGDVIPKIIQYPLPYPYPLSHPPDKFYFFKDDELKEDIMYTFNYGELFYSDNSGDSWVKIELDSKLPYVNTLIVNPNDKNTIYIGTSNSGVYRCKITPEVE